MYKIDGDRCLLSTTDFFPPVVSDARAYGRIAAANALSDIYAMGGSPLYALNIVCFPQGLDQRLLQDIMEGGAEKCFEAGALLAGGHSIYDKEIMYGLAVTGIVSTGGLYRNNTPREGDALILTKPLGVGIIAAAHRDGEADAPDIAEAIASMERLNRYASEKIHGFNISACTDVTGFGLAVHALEMTAGNLTAEINGGALPYITNVRRYIDDDYVTGGGRRNRDFAGTRVSCGSLPVWIQELVYDPQTSGGLLIAVDAGEAEGLLRAIREAEPRAAIIGRFLRRGAEEVVFH